MTGLEQKMDELEEKYGYRIVAYYDDFYMVRGGLDYWRFRPELDSSGEYCVKNIQHKPFGRGNFHRQWKSNLAKPLSLDEAMRYIAEHDKSQYQTKKICYSVDINGRKSFGEKAPSDA